MEEKPDCVLCRKIKGDQTNCDVCIPKLLSQNTDVINVYNEVIGQFVMGPNGPIDVRVDAIYTAMDEIGIPNDEQAEVKHRVRNLILHVLRKHSEKVNNGK